MTDIQREIINFLKSHWKTVCTITVLFILFTILPAFFIYSNRRWQNFGAWATWFYAITAFFTFVVIVATAFLAVHQLSEIKKSRQLGVIFEISKTYSTPEMYHALRIVFDDSSPPEKFIQDRQKDFQRRLVVNFWETVALAALEDQAASKLVRLRFEQAMKEAWIKLRPLEIAKRLDIAGKDHEEWSDEKKYALAEHHVNSVLSFERCFASWAALQKQEEVSTPFE